MALTYSQYGQFVTAWTASTTWSLGNICSNNGNLYKCIAPGTSATAYGPNGTGSSIEDGTATWAYYSANVTYPPGAISTYGKNLAKENRAPHITYVGPNGTKFYLTGPLAPMPGAQNGLTMLSVMGLTPQFKHLDNQGAHQDGTSWMDTVYDSGEIDFVVEATGLTPANMRAVMRSWQGAWNPKEQGRLHVFTPENGEWWARVRQLKNFNDKITYSHEKNGRQRFTWSARNDDAFWESFDSVDSFKMDLSTASDTFSGSASSTLGSNWNQTYYSVSGGVKTKDAGAGTCGLDGAGNAHWTASGIGAREVVNRRINSNATSATDYQIVSLKINAPVAFDLFGGVFFDIWGRMDSYGNGIRARIGGNGVFNSVTLSRFTGGTASVNATETVMWGPQPLIIPPLWNEKWTLLCGTTNEIRNFKIQRGDGFTVVNHTESGTASLAGPSYRGWGWGVAAGPSQTFTPKNLVLFNQVAPPDIQEWSAGDNNTVTQSGKVTLINRGDLEAWPRYLCYGPGTFTFGDGADNNSSSVSFGPLLEDQVVLVTTLPRLRGVVDLSSSSLNQQVVDGEIIPLAIPGNNLTEFQKQLKGLIDLATNNNVPPLLENFESMFGILPPQGPLYSLLEGRFTTPLAAKDNDAAPVASSIPVQIVDGNADSKVVAAITPRRRWPM